MNKTSIEQARPPRLPSVVSEADVWDLYFLLLILISLMPIWMFQYVPTQDGPAHLESAMALIELSHADPGIFRDFFIEQWRIGTNQVYHLLLVALGSFLPLLLAEKLVLSAYVILLPLATRYTAGKLSLITVQAIFLIFPIIYSPLFYMGLFNYCFGLIFYVLVIGLYFNRKRIPSRTNTIKLTVVLLLTFFVHIVASAAAIVTLLIIAGVEAFDSVRKAGHKNHATVWHRKELWKEALQLGLIIAPTILMIALFFIEMSAAPRPPTDAPSGFSSILWEILTSFRISSDKLRVFTTFSAYDLLIAIPFIVLIVTTAFIALHQDRQQKVPSNSYASLLVSAIVFLVMFAVSPDRLGEIGSVPDRLILFVLILAILWLSTQSFSNQAQHIIGTLSIMMTVAAIASKIPVHAMFNYDIREYVSVSQYIERNSTLLPLHIKDDIIPNGLVAMRPRVRPLPLTHAAGYLSIDRKLVDLSSYQARTGYFPLQFRDDANPAAQLSPDSNPSRYEYRPFRVDLEKYKQRTGFAVDYVLLWGYSGNDNSDDVQSVIAQLEKNYILVCKSAPRALVSVYRAK